MSKLINKEDIIKYINDNTVLMIGGFLCCGAPNILIDEVLKSGKKNLTIISNDTAFIDRSHGKLIVNKQVKKVIATHIGTNKETGNQMNSGELEVELVPQGTLAERIRAAGSGLGGILTPTGLGTIVAEGKKVINVKGVDYLLEEPLFADVALIYADVADKYGNLSYHGSTRNFNTVMAQAAKVTIVQAQKVVESLDPNHVIVPSIFVNYIVEGGC